MRKRNIEARCIVNNSTTVLKENDSTKNYSLKPLGSSMNEHKFLDEHNTFMVSSIIDTQRVDSLFK